jgi:hypothetical protein
MGKSRSDASGPEGNVRGEPVGECGTPASEPVLSTPSRGGQRSRPPAGAGPTIPDDSLGTSAVRGLQPSTLETGSRAVANSMFVASEWAMSTV